MSVVIETTIGDITVDLYVKERPNACLNFLKLCKVKYYNLCLFYKIEKNFIAQAGDPTATGRGGESIFSHLYGDQAKYFDAELKPRLKHEKLGTLSMVNNGNNMNGSQFFLTLSENLTYLDENHSVFGEVAEGFDVLHKLNDAICDNNNRPYQDIRITHTVVLHDPFDDPAGLEIPDASPEPTTEMLESGYIRPDEEIDENKGKNAEEVEEKIKESEAKARATILEMVGDIPDADVKPPENVLFVCKLNPVTSSEDLEVIFSRFGKILSCEVIKDKKTGESLQYAFIEFEREEDCEAAYFKMDNVLIDDRRIHVDFSQSVSKLYFNRDNPNSKTKTNFSIKHTKKNDGYDLIFETKDSIADDISRERKSNEAASKSKNSSKKSKSYEDQRKSRTDEREDLKYSYRKDKHAKNSKYSSDEESHRHRKSDYSYSPSRNKSERNRSHSYKKDYSNYSEMSRYSKNERSHKYRDAEYSTPSDRNKYSDNKSKSKYSSHSVPQNYKETDHHRRSSPKQKLHKTSQRYRKDSVSPDRSKKSHKLKEEVKTKNTELTRAKSSSSSLKRKTSDKYHSSKKYKAKSSRSSSVSSSSSSTSSSSSSSSSSSTSTSDSSSSKSSSDSKYEKSRPSSQSKSKKKHSATKKEHSKSNKKKYKS